MAAVLTVVLTGCGTTVPGAVSSGSGTTSDTGLEMPGLSLPHDPTATTGAGVPAAAEGRPGGAVGAADDGGPGGDLATAPGVTGPRQAAPASKGATTAPLLIGVEVIKNGDAAFKTIGLGVTYGDQLAQVDAVVKHINAHGGAGGRPVKAVVYQNDVQSSTSYEGREQEACTLWTEDQRVDVAVSPLTHGALLADCLRRQGVPLLNSGATVDGEALSASPNLFLVNRLTLSRAVTQYVDALAAAGFFADGAKVGVVYADAEPFRRVKARDLEPALRRHGVIVEREAAIDIVNQQAYVSGSQNAVLQFASAGIDRVLFVEVGGGLPYIFATSAENQRYRPRYGLSSDNAPAYLAGALPAAQLTGATGVGWLPVVDTGAEGARLAPAGQACQQIHRAAGQSATSDTQAKFMAELCDLLLFAQAALNRAGGRTDLASFVRGAESVGSAFRSAATFAVTIDAARHDGAARSRPLAYVADCTCFRYTGPQRPAG